MVLEDVPTPYIRKSGMTCGAKKYYDDKTKTEDGLGTDAVWGQDEWTHRKTPQGKEYRVGWTSYWAKSCLRGNWTRDSTDELYCAKSCVQVFPVEYTSMIQTLCGLEIAASMLDKHCLNLGYDLQFMSDEFQSLCFHVYQNSYGKYDDLHDAIQGL